MNGNCEINLSGKYHVELKNSITNEVVQSEDFHNIGCINIANCLVGLLRPRYKHAKDISYQLSVGSGTTQPKYTDTGLTSQLWTAGRSSYSHSWINDYKFKVNASYVFPATSSYVGKISEAGLRINSEDGYSFGNRLVTHALFTDSEGNVISINKTDLDILTINVELIMSFGSKDNSFFMYPRPPMMNEFKDSGFNFKTSNSLYDNMGLCCLLYYDSDRYFRQTFNDQYAKVSYGYSLGSTSYNSGVANSDGTAYVKFNNVRLSNTVVTNETYFRGLSIQGYGCFMLPNEELFPTYTISNISIGTGDGETTEFECPLGYFKKDTEEIFVNNVKLTKEEDYTINNRGNHQKSFILCQDDKPTVNYDIKNNDEIWGNCTTSLFPLFIPSMTYFRPLNESDFCYGINNDNPAILDFGEEKTFNFIKGLNLRVIRKQKSNGAFSTIDTTAKIYIDKSNDGEDFEDVFETSIANKSIDADFESESARYWRIRTNLSAEDDNYYYLLFSPLNYATSSNPSYPYYGEHHGIALGNYDPNIVFTTPPEADAEIKMNVGMDIIMKNGNFAVDIASKLNFEIN